MMGTSFWNALLVLINGYLLVPTDVKAQNPFCVGEHEIKYFDDRNGGIKKSFASAKQACNGENGYLVKMDKTVNRQVFPKIKSNLHYYIGAERCGDTFCWLDGTKVDKSIWSSSEPTTGDCVYVQGEKYGTNYCGANLYYICQKNRAAPTIAATDLVITNASSYNVLCSAILCPPTWIKNSTVITKAPNPKSPGVTQNVVGEFSRLWFVNPTEKDSGRFYCRTPNNNSESYKVLDVKVHGRPVIQELIISPCYANVTLIWTPSRYAVNYTHSITVQNGPVFQVTPQTSEKQRQSIFDLSPSTEYELAINTCKGQCTGNFVPTKIKIITGGIPNNITDLKSRSTNVGLCNVTWNAPAVTVNVTEYQIFFNQTSIIFRGNSPFHRSTGHIASNTSFSFIPRPNMKYSVSVSAINCAGSGSPSQISTSCKTPPAGAPKSIASPVIVLTKIRNSPALSLTIPSEETGLMSCLLVVITTKLDEAIEVRNITNISGLNNALGKNNSGYVTFAIPPSRFSKAGENVLKLSLSDNSNSSCNVSETFDIANTNGTEEVCVEEIICGSNRRLQDFSNYSTYVIAVVPTNGLLSIVRSEVVPFNTSETIKETNSPIGSSPNIGGIVAGALAGVAFLLLVCLVVILVMKRKRKDKYTNDESSDTPQIPRAVYEEPIALRMENIPPALPARPIESEYEVVTPKEDPKVYMNIEKGEQEMKSKSAIKLKKLEAVYNQMKKYERKGFQEQYQTLLAEASKLSRSTVVASNPLLKSKNRYKNILPYDSTRVVLKETETGYINACFIDGYSIKKKFIATQGPLSRTVGDFWIMVFEQSSSIIVMLTKTQESGKKKCERYWPVKGKTMTFETLTVENVLETQHGGYICRNFRVSNGQESLPVTQYHFVNWPDHGVPQLTTNIIHMHGSIMRQYEEGSKSGSIIVHCSAGAGRTGTFIGFDILLEEGNDKGAVDFFQCILKMRDQRVDMVQNTGQYTYLHKLILESYIYGDTDLSVEDFAHDFADLNNAITFTRLQSQYNSLGRVLPMNDTLIAIQGTEYIDISRAHSTPMFSYSRAKVNIIDGEDEPPIFNGCWIQAEDASVRVIASCTPQRSSIDVFWRALLDNTVGTIVMLSSHDEFSAGENSGNEYWLDASGNEQNSSSMIEVSSCEKQEDITKTQLSGKILGQRVSLTHIHYQDWDKRFFPGESDLISLIDQVKASAKKAQLKTILVHCSDGVGRTGMFCTLMNVIDRIKSENRVDMLRAVKDLTDARPNIVESEDQFVYCCKVIHCYLESIQLYSVA